MGEFRIFGPPGTGKTTTLTKLITRAAAKNGTDAVLAASFTKAAAHELLSKDLPINEDHVATLHGLCYRALGRPPLVYNYLKDWNKQYPRLALSQKRVSGFDKEDVMGEGGSEETPGNGILEAMDLLRAKRRPKSTWRADIADFAGKWGAFKAELSAIDYSDMIERCLHGGISPQGNIRVGFFDEAQDFSRLELDLVRQWGNNFETTIIAGDDDQTIYGFAGATPDAFLTPDLPPGQKEVLNQSYRLPRAVHAFSDKWIKNVTAREEKVFNPREEEGSVTVNPGNWRQPYAILESVLNDVNEGRSVMFLGSCSYMLRPLIKLLREEGQPFANRYRSSRSDWNPLKPERGVSTANRIMAYLKPSFEHWGEDTGMWTEYDCSLFAPLLKAEVMHKGAKKRLTGDVDDRRELEVSELLTIFQDQAVSAMLDHDLKFLEDNALASKKNAIDFPLRVLNKHGGEGLHQDPAITVGTIHSVKGGEADSVYLMPDLSLSAFQNWAGGMQDEIYRVMYVGMSRARQHLHLCSPMSNLSVQWL